MTLDEFENALHKLLDDAIKGGLNADDIMDAADAIVNNTFLDDDCDENNTGRGNLGASQSPPNSP